MSILDDFEIWNACEIWKRKNDPNKTEQENGTKMTNKLKLEEVFPLTGEDGAAWLLSHGFHVAGKNEWVVKDPAVLSPLGKTLVKVRLENNEWTASVWHGHPSYEFGLPDYVTGGYATPGEALECLLVYLGITLATESKDRIVDRIVERHFTADPLPEADIQQEVKWLAGHGFKMEYPKGVKCFWRGPDDLIGRMTVFRGSVGWQASWSTRCNGFDGPVCDSPDEALKGLLRRLLDKPGDPLKELKE